jgi:hypothetical protein
MVILTNHLVSVRTLRDAPSAHDDHPATLRAPGNTPSSSGDPAIPSRSLTRFGEPGDLEPPFGAAAGSSSGGSAIVQFG